MYLKLIGIYLRETKRHYKDLFLKIIRHYLNEMTDKLKFKFCKISNIWYQNMKKIAHMIGMFILK